MLRSNMSQAPKPFFTIPCSSILPDDVFFHIIYFLPIEIICKSILRLSNNITQHLRVKFLRLEFLKDRERSYFADILFGKHAGMDPRSFGSGQDGTPTQMDFSLRRLAKGYPQMYHDLYFVQMHEDECDFCHEIWNKVWKRLSEHRTRFLDETYESYAQMRHTIAVSSYFVTAVRTNPLMRSDLDVALIVLPGCGHYWKDFTDSVKFNVEALLAAIKSQIWCMQQLNDKYYTNRSFMLRASQQNSHAFVYASSELRSDPSFVLEVAQVSREFDRYFVTASPKLRGNYDFMLQMVRINGGTLRHSPTFQGNEQIVYEAVQKDGLTLQCASVDLRANRRIVCAAVKRNWMALSFASPHLRADQEIVRLALQQNARARMLALSPEQVHQQ